MTLDDEECFRTAHLGAAVAHFESRFSIDLAGRAAEAFGYLQLHGAAVEASSGTVLIVEGEGKGKTSLALALLALGAAPVTDDSILLVPGQGRIARVPRLFRFEDETFTALAEIRKPTPDYVFHYDPENQDASYYFVDAFAEKGFAPGFSAPVSMIVFPEFSSATKGARLIPQGWGEALRILFHETMSVLETDLFPRWLEPLEGARCVRLEWGNLKEAAEVLWHAIAEPG